MATTKSQSRTNWSTATLPISWVAWSVQLWGRNLLDERYGVRGFYFGLEPPGYADKLYKTYGDPRQIGVRLTTQFGD